MEGQKDGRTPIQRTILAMAGGPNIAKSLKIFKDLHFAHLNKETVSKDP